MEEAKEEVKEEVKEEQKQEEQVDIYGFLGQFKDAPSKDQIDIWKNECGHVFVSNFPSTGEAFLWRPLRRLEYKDLMAKFGGQDQDMMEEQVVQKCILWPTITALYLQTCFAGTISTLSAQIMEGSNFLSPMQAFNLVTKL